MRTLAEVVSVAGRFARSANLERDSARVEPLDGYVVTARALDVLERIARTAGSGSAGGAWSLTGPYGSGKSSLALLVDAAFGDAPNTRRRALRLVGDTSPDVACLVREAHRRYGTMSSGFISGLATANREPLTRTVLRALHSAVTRRYGRVPSKGEFGAADTLRAAVEDAALSDPRRSGPSPAALVEVARSLAAEAPLLLIIDEFGKNLEAFRDGVDADPYLLQQLAEAGQSSVGLPIFLLTLQHLSFEDYLGGADISQRREWAKVQGRFEDIAFVEAPSQTRALIRTVFDINDTGLKDRVGRWADGFTHSMRRLGVPDLATPGGIASCYPLHPLAALVLPELCSRYGQHERTLFSFLAGPDAAGMPSFLTRNEVSADQGLPSVGLADIYDFFVSKADPRIAQSSRWTEIAVRIRDSHGLPRSQEQLAKTIAVLNLVSIGGTIRASKQVLELIDSHAADTLVGLEAAGIVTYRDYADEYRIWQGTDVDLRSLLESARHQAQRQPLVEILKRMDGPSPMIASRHSAKNQTLRIFKRSYAAGSGTVETLDAFSTFDGEVLLVVDPDRQIPGLEGTEAEVAKPVIAVVPSDLAALDGAAREAAAVSIALQAPVVVADRVARGELAERLAQVRSDLDLAAVSTFGEGNCDWFLLRDGGERSRLPRGRGSVPLSTAADIAYPNTPTVRNEMINRASLTSQGAKARRMLLEAMISHGGDQSLAISGYGPEMAIYQAFLKGTGLHGYDERNQTMTFRSPTDESLRPAWDSTLKEFRRAKSRRINVRDVYRTLLSPPIGMKEAVIPVFVTAALLAYTDEIAIYEHGTFQPRLTPELSERMVANPAHFDIKHFANTTGARREVITHLASSLEVRPRFRRHRVSNVLEIVAELVTRMASLDNYTRRTRNLTPKTIAARNILLTAVEPDQLLFEVLPGTLGFSPIPADSDTYLHARSYAQSVAIVTDELQSAYPSLLERLMETLLAASAETSRRAVSGQAAALADEVLNPTVRAFVRSLANDFLETDRDWISAIATVVIEKAPAEWTDADLNRFEHEIPQHVAAFRRLVALHTEHRAHGGGPFEAFRVTYTRADGTEDVRLVSVNHDQRDYIEHELDRFVKQLAENMGTSPQSARNALLASLGKQLLPSQPDTEDTPIAPLQPVRHHHG